MVLEQSNAMVATEPGCSYEEGTYCVLKGVILGMQSCLNEREEGNTVEVPPEIEDGETVKSGFNQHTTRSMETSGHAVEYKMSVNGKNETDNEWVLETIKESISLNR
ncbi:hypothetical protein PIB30_033949 [Stylosanthes scabra]|uniref:Uncharacterized protein n=1 Tax=Stylosanthes scabra TaxID=79078 RepID=A0ABU6QCA2_9FABA|nr:hypothetical protein [Stylosanthes scabra]